MAELTYKGKLLTRVGNEIYYGNPEDPNVLFIQILNMTTVDGVEVPGKVHIQLLSTDPSLVGRERIKKESEKNGLYQALELGEAWLKKENAVKA